MSTDGQKHLDGWENVYTGLNTSRDKRTGATMRRAAPNISREIWDTLYASDDVAATAADLPAQEMVREWITIHTEETEDADGEETLESVSAAKGMEQRLQEIHARSHIREAITWARVFGGSVMLVGADDGQGSDPMALRNPLNEDNILSIDFLRVFDRWDVDIAELEEDISNENFGGVKTYRIRPRTIRGGATQQEMLVHSSRVIRFDGPTTSNQRRITNGGWNDSIYSRLEEILRDFGQAWGGVFHLMTDISQGVMGIRGLQEALTTGNDELVIKRLRMLDMCRSVMRMVPIDSDGESFERKPTPVGGVPELLDRMSLRLAAAFRMPVALLFGQSPAGLQATGDADIRFFYDQISAQQEDMLRPKLERLIQLLFKSQDGPTGGEEPDRWTFIFNPLWQMSDAEMADIRLKQAQADAIYIDRGVVTEQEIAVSRFGGDAYSVDTHLDIEERARQKSIDQELEEQREAALMAAVEEQPEPPPPPPAEELEQVDRHDIIQEVDGKFRVLSKAGRFLGEHSTMEEALDQLAAIEANKDG